MNTARSKQRYILMSPRKLRRVINEVRGKNALEAYQILRFMPYRAAKVVLKNLHAAVNNAQQKYGESVSLENLVVSQIMADKGPVYRRFRPRAQGRVYKVEKPTAHLMVEVAVKA